MSQSEKGLINEYNRLFVIVSRSVEHYKHAKKNFTAVNEKFISMRKLLTAEQKNFEKAKAHNPNSPRIAIIDSEMKKLISNLNALKPELQRKHRIAKQAHHDVKTNRKNFEAIKEKVLSEERNKSQIGSLKKPEEIQAFDVSSFNAPGRNFLLLLKLKLF